MPDHATPCAIKTHTSAPVPYLLFDSTHDAAGREYTERGVAGSEAVDGHGLVERHGERRNVLEGDLADPRSVTRRTRRDPTRWRVIPHDVALPVAGLEEGGGQRDDAVAAHRTPALVVHEQHAEVAVSRHWLGGDRPVHVRMPARLEHDRPADPVEVLARVAALLQHGPSRDLLDAAGDDAERLARRVRFARRDAPPLARGLPPLHQARR